MGSSARWASGVFGLLGVLLLSPLSARAAPPGPDDPTAEVLIAGAIDLTRGRASYTVLTMTIHRPEWERTSTLEAWTRGRDDALIRFTAPARDAGNGTLKTAEKMWTFTPKLNRVIRLPASLMSESWAGSDFSYNDLSRTDDLLTDYRLTLTDMRVEGEHTLYTVEAVPHDDSPVVWGKQELVLRDDYVLLKEVLFDQEMVALKSLEALEVAELGGRTFATRMRMNKLDDPDHYTELAYEAADFDVELDDSRFTVFALRGGASG